MDGNRHEDLITMRPVLIANSDQAVIYDLCCANTAGYKFPTAVDDLGLVINGGSARPICGVGQWPGPSAGICEVHGFVVLCAAAIPGGNHHLVGTVNQAAGIDGDIKIPGIDQPDI